MFFLIRNREYGGSGSGSGSSSGGGLIVGRYKKENNGRMIQKEV